MSVTAPPPSPVTAFSSFPLASMDFNVRDESYYLSDGNTVILVSRTLFKVHRTRLTQDQSIFGDMFSLDDDSIYANAEDIEGCSDEKPIVLEGDTVEEFRDLLWCLYALPHEIAGSMGSRTSILRLTNVVRMAHKYHFVNIEQWGLQTLTSLYSNTTILSPPLTNHRHSRPLPQVPGTMRPTSISGGLFPHDTSDPALSGPESVETQALVQTTEVAILTRHRPLLSIMRTRWKERIGERRDLSVAVNLFSRTLPQFTPPSPPTLSYRFSSSHRYSRSQPSTSSNLPEAERYDLDDLQGLAYYGLMLQGRHAWNRDPLLNREHRIRLLSGYHELTKLCDALPNHPPVFTHVTEEGREEGRLTPTIDNPRGEVCFNTPKCREAWCQLWNNITRSDSDFSSLALVLYQASNASAKFSPPTVSGSTPGNERADYMWKMMLAISIIQALVEQSIPRENLMLDDLNEACAARGLEAAREELKNFRNHIMDFFDDVD